jgi:hypothetical protein
MLTAAFRRLQTQRAASATRPTALSGSHLKAPGFAGGYLPVGDAFKSAIHKRDNSIKDRPFRSEPRPSSNILRFARAIGGIETGEYGRSFDDSLFMVTPKPPLS